MVRDFHVCIGSMFPGRMKEDLLYAPSENFRKGKMKRNRKNSV